jgi:hypothetical protein
MNLESLVNELIHPLLEDKIPGGMSEKKTLEDFYKHHDPKGNYSFEEYKKIFNSKLKEGIKTEMEHTTSSSIAKEIAMDHLWEDLNYYDKLKKIESKKNQPNSFDEYLTGPLFESNRIYSNMEEDFTNHLKHITQYMIKSGLNINPLPQIKIISNDKQNASNILGKTAYYTPENKSITLYTFGRHPKDILSSFCHEIIHHVQNLEGRLNDINTTNVLEDDNLYELEKEAYQKGGLIFRQYQDFMRKKT